MYCLSDEQKQLKRSVKKFVEEEIFPVSATLDRSGVYPKSLIERIGELGYTNVLFNTNTPDCRYGATEGVIIIEELSRGLGSIGLVMCPHYQCCDLISQDGSKELKRSVLAPAMEGGNLLAYALSEASGGSDALGIDTTAMRSGDSWILNGAKCWVTSSGFADGYIVAAKTAANGRSRSVSLFYVDRHAPGLEIFENDRMLGMFNSPIGAIRFADCRIPLDCLIGTENEGYKLIKLALNEGRLSLSAVAIGIAQRAMELSTEYSSCTGQYGRSLSSYQGISFKIADMYTNIAAARYMLYHVASLCATGISYTAQAAALKLFSTEMCCKVCKDACQIHGANGLSRELEVERQFRDAHMLTIAEGTSEICKIIVSNAMYHSKVDDFS